MAKVYIQYNFFIYIPMTYMKHNQIDTPIIIGKEKVDKPFVSIWKINVVFMRSRKTKKQRRNKLTKKVVTLYC